MRRRLFTLTFAASAAVVLVVAALAFACSPQAGISLTPNVGPAGSTVTVAGSGFSRAGGPVEVYWNSRSTAPVASAEPDLTGKVSLSFSVPAGARGGYYTVIAIQNPAFPARAVFQVPGSSAPPEPAPQPGGAGQPPATVQPPSAGEPPAAVQQPSAGQRPSGDGRRRSTPGQRTPAEAPRAGEGPAALNSPVVGDRSGRPVFSGSLAPAAAARSDRGAAAGPSTAAAGPAGEAASAVGGASQRSASGDLWSGFSSERSPSLTGGPHTALPTTKPGPAQAVGLALLGLGLSALLAGFVIAAARRRKPAENPRSR